MAVDAEHAAAGVFTIGRSRSSCRREDFHVVHGVGGGDPGDRVSGFS